LLLAGSIDAANEKKLRPSQRLAEVIACGSHLGLPARPKVDAFGQLKRPAEIPELWPAAGSNDKPAAGIDGPTAGICKPAVGGSGIRPAVGDNWAGNWAGMCWAVQL